MNCPEKDKWLIAAKKELSHHVKNGTWRPVEHTGQRLLTLRWVFKIKHEGTYKARLVVRGFRQLPGVDYKQVYAVVANQCPSKFSWLLRLQEDGICARPT